MEGNENQLGCYFQQQQQQQHQSSNINNINGLVEGQGMAFPHSQMEVEPPKRKRGRPRKYGTPEQALAAKKAATSSHSFHKKPPHSLPSPPPSSAHKSSLPSPSFSLGTSFFFPFYSLCVLSSFRVDEKPLPY